MKLTNRLSVAALVAALASTAGSSSSALAQSAEERQQLDQIVTRGRLLFGIDRAAWVGTDDMLGRIPDPAAAGIRGYIVDRDPEGFTVIFYAGDREEPVAAYKGQVRANGIASREIFPIGQRPPLTATQRRMVAAVEAARQTDRRPCGRSPFNPLVVPPESADKPVEVYLMTPQTKDALPVGGHYKVTVSADGKIAGTRPFANSCLAMPAKQKGAAMLVVSHVLDPLPTETHVFTAMAAGVPMAVVTTKTGQIWRVSANGISAMERPKEKRP
jgi:hypothetical protein